MSRLKLGFASTFGTAEEFFKWVLSKEYDVEVVPPEQCDYLIFGDPNFGNEHERYRNCKRILYTGENYRPTYFGYDHSITFDHENSPKNYRLPLYVLEMHMYWRTGNSEHTVIPSDGPMDALGRCKAPPPDGFATFVQSNPNMPIRNNFVQMLNKYKQVDCGGPLFNNIGYVLPRDDIKNKRDFLRDRKFNVAFENGIYPGYVTEKILDAIYARTIPIYLGSMTVDRDFNTKRFINCHDYTTLNEVMEVIKEIDQDEKKWIEIIKEPVWPNNIPPACTNPYNFLDWWDKFVY
jgi:hypothetical protein